MVAKQVTDESHTKESHLIKYFKKVLDLSKRFKAFEIKHVPREKNFGEDMFSKLSSLIKAEFNRTIILETLATPIIKAREANDIDISLFDSWMMLIIHYLQLR